MTNCKYCNEKTQYESTKLCHGCWELERRIRNNPELAAKIFNEFLKSLENDNKRIEMVEDSILVGICPLCGGLRMPCYCAPQYDI